VILVFAVVFVLIELDNAREKGRCGRRVRKHHTFRTPRLIPAI
jgi:hypothetical protein